MTRRPNPGLRLPNWLALLATFTLAIPASTLASWSVAPIEVCHAQDRDPARRAEIIRRYKGMLEQTPKEGFVLKQLLKEVGLGQQLERMIEEYRERSEAKPKALALKLILGHLLKAAQRNPEALEAYEEALKLDDKNADAWLGKGFVLQAMRRSAEAQEAFQKALDYEKSVQLKQDILRRLADIAFSRRDFEAADTYYKKLIELEPSNQYLRIEYADVLTQHKQYDKALAQYEKMKRLAGRNVKQRIEAMKYIGDVLALMGKRDEAVKTWRQAMGQVTGDSYIQKELEQRIIQAYRDTDDLVALIDFYEKRWRAPSFDQAMILAGLYDETGQEDKALSTFRQALKKNARSVDARLRVIRLLERRGQTKDVIKEYKALIRAEPGQVNYAFELAEIYWRQGDKRNAMGTLAALERKSRRDVVALTNIAELYLQWGAREKALRIYQTLVRIAPSDPTHLTSLGEFHWVEGKREEAMKTWKRILTTMPVKAEAHAELGQVYANHNLVDEAVKEFEKAIKLDPDNEKYYRRLALVYERSRRMAKAIETWMVVLSKARHDHSRREARSRVIQIHHRRGTLRSKIGEFKKGFAKTPPDLEDGFFLGESYIVLKDFPRAESVFSKLVELSGGNTQALISLHKIYTETNEHDKNIEILRKLAKADPLRAADYYHTMAELSLKTYDDQSALEFARFGVDQNPNDANAHANLGKIYRQMQDLPRAAAEYRTAIDLDNQAFVHYFELAEIYHAMDQVREADTLYRNLVRKAREEGDIQRAARKSIDINDSLGTLPDLEKVFVPMLSAQPPKKVYTRILIELYDRMTRSLIAEVDNGSDEDQKEAERRLRDISRRALGPLLVALNDDDSSLRTMTIRILGDLRNGNASIPLAKLMEDEDPVVRVHAALAVGKLADDRALTSVIRALDDEDRTIRQIAVWAIGRMGSKAGVRKLMDLLDEPDWSVRALAAIGLGRLESAEAVKLMGPRLASPSERDGRAEVRIAMAWALGAVASPKAFSFLVDAVNTDPDPNVQRMAAWALGNVDSDDALGALVKAYWTREPAVRTVAGKALLRLGADARGERPPYAIWEDKLGFYDQRSNVVDVGFIVDVLLSDELLSQPGDGYVAVTRGEKIISDLLVTEIGRADSDTLVRILGDLDLSRAHLSLGDLTTTMPDKATRRDEVLAALGRIAKTLVPRLLPLLESSDPLLRAQSAGILGKTGERSAVQGLVAAMKDNEREVRRRAALSLGQLGDKSAVGVLLEGLEDDYYGTRANSARALGMLKAKKARPALVKALDDRFQWVQEGAAEGLGHLGERAAVAPLVAKLESADPGVKVAILRALTTLGGAEADKALERYENDPDPRLRDPRAL